MDQNKINEIVNKISNKNKEIYKSYQNINKLELDIRNLKKELYNKCQHNWTRDWDEQSDSHCKWKCKLCGINRNHHCL
mgnify:FL=1|jgi:hypothetical protein